MAQSTHTTFVSENECTPWTGRPAAYQDKAAEAYYTDGHDLNPWDWMHPACGTPMCLTPDHLAVQANARLKYPANVCIYCGNPAFTKDHLLPRNWTGDGRRKFVVTVPACGTCNSLLGATLTESITERRELAHARIRKHYRKVLRHIDYSPSELSEFGPTLRSIIEEGMENKKAVENMLAWPDPGYDERALAKSGIEDPYAIGLIEEVTPTLLAKVRGELIR